MFGVNINSDETIIDNELDEFLKNLKIDYSQFYRGIVVDNYDPEFKGRVKVRIPQIYGTVNGTDTFLSNDAIPWATCAISPAGNDSGTFLPPNIGDTVFVTFESGLPYSPIYFGGIYTNRNDDENEGIENRAIASHGILNDEFQAVTYDDAPSEIFNGTERILYKSLKGATVYFDDKDGEEKIRIVDQSGQCILMENTSKEPLSRRGNNLGKNRNSQIVITNCSGDNISITQGRIHIKSKNIILETDNLIQKGITHDFTDEESVADIILGKAEEEINTLQIYVRDIKTNEIIDKNFYVSIERRYNEEDMGESIGRFGPFRSQITIPLSLGRYVLTVETVEEDDGYYYGTSVINFEHTGQIENVYLTPITENDEIQAVLTWNGNIQDLDSHTKIYNQNNTSLGHVSYNEKTYRENNEIKVQLDLDDTDGYGPETTTMNISDTDKKYLFYIHRYSNSSWLNTNTKVIVYHKGEILREFTFNPPSNLSSDIKYWSVFEYDTRTKEITVKDTMSSNEPSI